MYIVKDEKNIIDETKAFNILMHCESINITFNT